MTVTDWIVAIVAVGALALSIYISSDIIPAEEQGFHRTQVSRSTSLRWTQRATPTRRKIRPPIPTNRLIHELPIRCSGRPLQTPQNDLPGYRLLGSLLITPSRDVCCNTLDTVVL